MTHLTAINIVFLIIFSFAIGFLISYILIRVITMRKKASDEEILSKASVSFNISGEKVTLRQTLTNDEESGAPRL